MALKHTGITEPEGVTPLRHQLHRAVLLNIKTEYENRMKADFDVDLSYQMDCVNFLLSDLGAI